jgi:Outer membrane protein beta-barrel domain
MAKAYFLFWCLLLSICTLNAQLHYLSIGAKGGISIPGIQNNSKNPILNGYQSKIIMQGGVVLQIPVNKNWSVVSGVDYMPIAATKDGDQIIPKSIYASIFAPGSSVPDLLYSNFKSNININYLQVPIMAEYNFNTNGAFSFFVQSGVFIGLALNGTVNTEGRNSIFYDEARTRPFISARINLTQQLSFLQFVRDVNFGVQGAVGVKYNANFGTAFFQISANSGLIPIQKSEADGNNKSGALIANVGYLFNLYN